MRFIARLLLSCGLAACLTIQAAIDDQTAMSIEALRRLKDSDAASSPAVKQAVAKVLDKIQGEPEFIELVRDYKVDDRLPEVEKLALQQPGAPVGVQAIQLLLAKGRADALKAALAPDRPDPSVLLEALGNAADNHAATLVTPLITDASRPAPLRRIAVRAAVKSLEGAKYVLGLARDGKLPDDVRLVASSELNSVRWPPIRTEAAKLLPPPTSKGDSKLPPISALVSRTGDSARGAAVFRRQDVGCINCHQVNGEGVDFGPKLSEIGTKLGKDALYEAILDPSAGIAFGYEGWSIELKNGDEAFGLIASETEDEIVVKAQGGVLTHYKKADVAKREKQAQSIMPQGLQATMTTGEFVDLVEYLASLKKASK
jgi:putative heme-binding domain-containing protein